MAFLINGKNPIPPGPPGLSPYQVAAAGGYTGTEAEFNAALADIGRPQDAADPNGSLYARVNSLFTSVSEGKGLIAAAVTDKGVQTAADESFASMAGKIGQIEAGKIAKPIAITVTPSATSKPMNYKIFPTNPKSGDQILLETSIRGGGTLGVSAAATGKLSGTTITTTADFSVNDFWEIYFEAPDEDVLLTYTVNSGSVN